MKPDSTAAIPDPVEVHKGLWKVKIPHPKGLFRIGMGKRHSDNVLYLEINGGRKFEIGDDSSANHFWYKCIQEPRIFAQKKMVNLPKSLSIQRPFDAGVLRELYPVLEMMDRGEHYVLNMTLDLSGPYRPDNEESYFYNSEFLELWDIEDPAAEDLLSDWEHYESKNPRIFRCGEIMEKQFDFLIPLVPMHRLKQENVHLYHQMVTSGDRPHILVYGMYQRPLPGPVKSGHSKITHSYFAGFVLDGHQKLAAYRRTGVPVPCLVVLSPKASKYHLFEGEAARKGNAFEDRLASLAEA